MLATKKEKKKKSDCYKIFNFEPKRIHYKEFRCKKNNLILSENLIVRYSQNSICCYCRYPYLTRFSLGETVGGMLTIWKACNNPQFSYL